ncbi:hypothetical protein [Streptomyces sp. NPDC090036]|uniref:hypothetical protein n=1 Tax=Streptomyces sp. NPDC090036 TaxID=3365926 RepID=UPI0037FB3B4F
MPVRSRRWQTEQDRPAGVARTKFTATRYEYAAAQNQAKAIASLLRGGHEQLTDLIHRRRR